MDINVAFSYFEFDVAAATAACQEWSFDSEHDLAVGVLDGEDRDEHGPVLGDGAKHLTGRVCHLFMDKKSY